MKTQAGSADAGTRGVLLLGNYRPTLTLARVLSREGYRVVSGLEGCDGGAEHCRFVDELWSHRSVRTDPDGFLEDLRAFLARRADIDVVLPVSEEFVRLFSSHPTKLPEGPLYATPAPDLVNLCLDKLGLMGLAVDAGVPTAPFEMVRTRAAFHKAADRIGLPLVIRPEKSTDRIGGKKAVICQTAEDLAEVSALLSDRCALLLQRKASGLRHNIYFAAKDGKVVRYLHALILRTDIPDGTGLAVEGITIEPDAKLRTYTERLISSLGYTGVGCAQYLVDEEDGSVSFLEINPRIAGNHAVPEAAGLGLSTLAIELARPTCGHVAPIEGKAGLRYVWTCGDLLGAKQAYWRGEITAATSAAWMARAVKAAFAADVHMQWHWRDPMPALMSLRPVLPSLAGLARGALELVRPKRRTRHSPDTVSLKPRHSSAAVSSATVPNLRPDR